MIAVVQNGSLYEIRFPYDPEIKDLVKNVPGRAWHPEGKFWSIPLARLGFLIAQFKGTIYEPQLHIESDEDINVNASLDDPNAIPDVSISEYTYNVATGYHPFQHQLDSLKYAKWRYSMGLTSGFLLADEPGAGKTLEAANIAMYMRQEHNLQHCLIIACVNGAKYNWQEDIIKHTNGKEHPYILGSRIKRDKTIRLVGSGAEKLEDLTELKMYGKNGTDPLPFFLIVNIEAIRTRSGKLYPLADRVIELVNNNYIGMIVIDEIHRNCSMHSLQGKQLVRIKQKTNSCQWIPITGTPIVNRPTDAFLPLRLVDGHTSNSFYMWCQQFCIYGGFGGHDIIGYKNIPQLSSMLQPNMLRRLKKDFLDLPPKLHFTEYIENSPYQEKLYNQINDELTNQIDTIKRSLNPAAKFLRLRQVNGSPELVDSSVDVSSPNYLSKNAKLTRLLEILDDILQDPAEKVVIFSNWVEPLRTLYKFITKKYKVCCYTGTMSQHDREKHKQAFISNSKYRVLIGTVGALGVSHTLTVARNVIFYDSPWSPADIEQCEDRCHRPGATKSVNIYFLITKGTVDEKVHDVISKKEGTSKYIVDNQLDLRNHPEIIETLLRR